MSGNPAPTHNIPEYSVSEISAALKRTVEENFRHVRVRGEVGSFKRAASGHLYFTLKDENNVLDGVCFRNMAGKLAVAPEEGLEVVATGRLSIYSGRSRYQIIVEALEVAGEGALLKLLEERRRKLAAEGLFREEDKQPLPFLPEVIGVVTSRTGAVIRDIMHRLSERFPRHVLLWPVLVQGEGAAEQVAEAIKGFNALAPGGTPPRPDLLIVARGGGSLEDLWAFNEEVVVRAAAGSDIPLVTAVGHETDTTLIDYAADRRAPTPTGAAEIAVPVRLDLRAQVAEDGARLANAAARILNERRTRLEGLARGLPQPGRLIGEQAQRLDDRVERLANAGPAYVAGRRNALERLAARLTGPRELVAHKRHRLDTAARGLHTALDRLLTTREHRVGRAASGLRPGALKQDVARRGRDLTALTARLERAGRRVVQDKGAEVDRLGRLLDGLSYENVLKRGFAVVSDAENRLVESASAANPGAGWAVRFHDGRVDVTVNGGGAGAAPEPSRRAGRKRSGDDRQGSLL